MAEGKILAPTRKSAAFPASSVTIMNELNPFTILSLVIDICV
jgi:hypothetical protein